MEGARMIARAVVQSGGAERHSLWGACMMMACVLLLAACGSGGQSGEAVPFHLPTGWHDVSPPPDDDLASYAISPDVPGLIVACTAKRTGHVSADLGSGPPTFWRTRDGGAHWQRLDTPMPTCGGVFPEGGHGTLFALSGASPLTLYVSHDAGDTWRSVLTDDGTPGRDLSARFELLARGVYRDGALYTAGQADTAASARASATATASSLAPTPDITPQTRDRVSNAFSSSTDDSRTWTEVETTLDPYIAQGNASLAIAADYSAPGAWFRLLGPSYGGAGQAQAVLEHSTDGGYTWASLGNIGPAGMYYGPGSALLATSPAHPAAVCAAFAPEVSGQSAAQTSAGGNIQAVPRLGPPRLPPHELALATSSDSGRTWHTTTLAPVSGPYASLISPGVTMDAQGRCDATTSVGYPYSDTSPTISVWQADPKSTAQALTVAQMRDHTVSMATVVTVGGAERIVAVAETYQPFQEIICQGDVCPPEPPLPAPHLIWRPLP
jgi:hypothetical protein